MKSPVTFSVFTLILLFLVFIFLPWNSNRGAEQVPPNDEDKLSLSESISRDGSSPLPTDLNAVTKILASCGIDRVEVLTEAKRRRAEWPKFMELAFAHMSDLGIELTRGKHIEFYSDLPKNAEMEETVAIMDAAVDELCRFFAFDPNDYANWKIEAFLINDKEAFSIFGALDGAPEFPNGYSLGSRIWVIDQKQLYYNRFLLLHELTHSLMNDAFGTLNPRWFSEGIAEYLGLYRWENKKLALGTFPEDADAVPGFGRIDRIRKEIREGKAKSLEEIFAFVPDDYNDVATYGWSWGLVTFLDRHPRYHSILRALPYLMMTPNFNERFTALLQEKNLPLSADWTDFAANLDYCYDFEKTVIDEKPGNPITGKTQIPLDISAGGWQNSGIQLAAGEEYLIAASGKFSFALDRRSFPCQPNGVTFRYVNGKPIGQLLAVVVPDSSVFSPKTTRSSGKKAPKGEKLSPLAPWDSSTVIGTKGTLSPQQTGTLYFRVNLPTDSICRSQGTVEITVEKKPLP